MDEHVILFEIIPKSKRENATTRNRTVSKLHKERHLVKRRVSLSDVASHDRAHGRKTRNPHATQPKQIKTRSGKEIEQVHHAFFMFIMLMNEISQKWTKAIWIESPFHIDH